MMPYAAASGGGSKWEAREGKARISRGGGGHCETGSSSSTSAEENIAAIWAWLVVQRTDIVRYKEHL